MLRSSSASVMPSAARRSSSATSRSVTWSTFAGEQPAYRPKVPSPPCPDANEYVV